jgi:hypothetical protein
MDTDTALLVRGELGLYPMYIDIITRMCKYFNRLVNMPDTSLLYCALSEEVNVGAPWITCVQDIVDKCGMGKLTGQNNDTVDVCTLKSVLRERFESLWKRTTNNDTRTSGGNKLRTYRQLKKQFEFEHYLDNVKNTRDRYFFSSQFRISAHGLHIETGRYTTPPTPVHDSVHV